MGNITIPPKRYSSAAILLHWTIALLLLFQVSLGWRLEDMSQGVGLFAAYQLHKSIGITILLLSVLRLVIRVLVRRPQPVAGHPAVVFLAGAVHALLYVVMIGAPITGWIIVSTSKIKVPTLLFGAIPWPHLPLGVGWHDSADALHGALGFLLVVLIVLHVAGALRHHLMRHDLLGRMLPFRSYGALSAAAAVAIVAAFAAMAAAKLWPFPGAPVPVPAATPAPLDNAAEATNAANAIENAANVMATSANAVVNAVEAKLPPAPWKVAAGGRLGFSADYSGSPIEGSFRKWDANILFSPDDLPNSKIGVTIDLTSVDTADSQRDEMLTGSDFFDTGTHPTARFASRTITHRSGKAYRASGTLTLHGVSQPVTLDFTLDIKGDKASVSGSTPLNRTAFKVGSGEWAATDQVKDGVKVTFRFTANRTK